jgi:hypothetical protein
MCLMLLLVASKVDVVIKIHQNQNSVINELGVLSLPSGSGESSKATVNACMFFHLGLALTMHPYQNLLSYTADSSSTQFVSVLLWK